MRTALLIVTLFAVGCLGAEEMPELSDELQATGIPGDVIPIVGPDTCTLTRGRLHQCSFPSRVLTPLPMDTGVPLRSTFRRVLRGDCQAVRPLGFRVSSPDTEAPAVLRYLSEGTLVIRRDDSDPITQLSIDDPAPAFTSMTSFPASCRISIEVSINEPDIDTRADAIALLDMLDLRLRESIAERDAYGNVLSLLAAHDFLRAIVDNLYQEVTNDMMQNLRRRYAEAMPAFHFLASSQACAGSLGDQRELLLQLAGALFALGDASSWENADGTTKTLAELYSEFGPGGLVSDIEALRAATDPSLESQYRDRFDDAAEDVAEFAADLALAREQLASWL